MKKLGKFLMVLTLALAMVLPATNKVDAAANGTGTYVIIGDVVNVRSGPGTNYSVAKTLSYGSLISIGSISGKWGRPSTLNQYVCLDYAGKVSAASGTKKVTLSSGQLNVRSGPSTASYSRVITAINNGSKVTLQYSYGGWYYVKTATGYFGWVSGSYLK